MGLLFNTEKIEALKHSQLLRPILLILGFALLFSSCVPNKEIVYLQDEPDENGNMEPQTIRVKVENVIQPGDELYIRVSSLDEAFAYFDQSAEMRLSQIDVSLISYTVSEDGSIVMPVIGTINLKGMSLDEARQTVENAMKGYLNQPSVFVKFVDKTITILGYVSRPGVYVFSKKDITIFQALGYAGDLDIFGNRKRVLIIREEGDLVNRNYIDLTDPNLLSSTFYYVMPNDVIYVEPMKRRIWGADRFPFELLLSGLTTIVVVLTFASSYLYL